MRNLPVWPGTWRGVNLNHNAIYVECFIDEIAHATGQDPLALRRKLLARSPKHLAVLDAVAERVGGTGLRRAAGTAALPDHGIWQLCRRLRRSIGERGWSLRIHRIVAAIDPGHAVNPQQIEAQVEGSFAYGLLGALHGGITPTLPCRAGQFRHLSGAASR